MPKRDELLQNPEVKQMIAERAYYISEQQGFAPGRELDIWLQAETETVETLSAQTTTVAEMVSAAVKKAPRKTAAAKTTAKAPAKAKVETDGTAKPAARKRVTKKSE